MVSIFAIPEVVARRHLFLYRSNYSTYNNTFQVRKDDIHSVGARVYVYLLSETYLNDGQVASATINVRVLADFKPRHFHRQHFVSKTEKLIQTLLISNQAR